MSGPDVVGPVLEAEQARCRAVVAGDMETLAGMLADELLFVHANATTDTKASLLAKLQGGAVTYGSLLTDEIKVVAIEGGLAVLSGRVTAEVVVQGTPKTIRNLALFVWTRQDGGWRLLAYQPTPIS